MNESDKDPYGWAVVALLIVVLSFVLFGCCEKQTPPVCPSLHEWSLSEQQQLKKEINALKPDSLLLAATLNYAKMRAEARACQTFVGNNYGLGR